MTDIATLYERARNQRFHYQELCAKQEKLGKEMLETIEAIIALTQTTQAR